MTKVFAAIITRELARMLRQRGRLISAMVRPLIWLLVIGTGFETMFQGLGAEGYKHFLVPGLLSMVLLFGSMLASLSLIYDKESGVMRMLVIAPFPHYWIIIARTASAVIVGVVQAIMLIVILAPFGYIASSINVPLLITGLLMTATVCASMGMLIAVYSKTLENFAVIMNFVIFPVFFLSGALYPLQHLPAGIRTIALINPFSYGVDLLKHAMMDNLQAGYQADFSISVDLAVMLLFSLIAVGIACMRFSQARVMEKLAKVLSNPKRV